MFVNKRLTLVNWLHRHVLKSTLPASLNLVNPRQVYVVYIDT